MVCNKMSAMLRDYYKVRFPLEKIFLVVYDEPANEGGQDMFPVQLRERHATVSGSRNTKKHLILQHKSANGDTI